MVKDAFCIANVTPPPPPGHSCALIANSFRELSKRMGERGQRGIVKFMYDRGSPKQVHRTTAWCLVCLNVLSLTCLQRWLKITSMSHPRAGPMSVSPSKRNCLIWIWKSSTTIVPSWVCSLGTDRSHTRPYPVSSPQARSTGNRPPLHPPIFSTWH